MARVTIKSNSFDALYTYDDFLDILSNLRLIDLWSLKVHIKEGGSRIEHIEDMLRKIR